MTARRQVVIDMYNEEIEAMYQAVEESAQAHIKVPETWTIEVIRDFVRSNVTNVLQKPMLDNDDLFQHGCDR